jgi:hypothetical protein
MKELNSINETLGDLLNEIKTTKRFIKESFQDDFSKLLNQAWQQPTEKQLIKILFKNKENITQDEAQGKSFISKMYEKNKSLIENNCSTDFVNAIQALTSEGDTGGGMLESVSYGSKELDDLHKTAGYISHNGTYSVSKFIEEFGFNPQNNNYFEVKSSGLVYLPKQSIELLNQFKGQMNNKKKQVIEVAKKRINESTTPEDLMRDEIVEYINNNKQLSNKLYHYIIGGEPEDGLTDMEIAQELTEYCLDGGLDDGETTDTYELMSKRIKGFGNPKLLDAIIEPEEELVYESAITKNIKANKQNRMSYRFYKVKFLNEAQYVGVPSFLVEADDEKSILQFALESKQIKTTKGVDFVVEISEKEFEEVSSDTEKSYGSKPKEAKPQDASKGSFDKVKDASARKVDDPLSKEKGKVKSGSDKGGAQQKDATKLKEAKNPWSFLFEEEDVNKKGMPEDWETDIDTDVDDDEFEEVKDKGEKLNEVDHNDPILMKLRAQQTQRAQAKSQPPVKQSKVKQKPQVDSADEELRKHYAQYGVTPEEAEANPDYLAGDGSIIEHSDSALKSVGKNPIVDAYNPMEEFDNSDVCDDVQQGDFVDFGHYGKLYVCSTDGPKWRVTDEESERDNPRAEGWYIEPGYAKAIIEPYSSEDELDEHSSSALKSVGKQEIVDAYVPDMEGIDDDFDFSDSWDADANAQKGKFDNDYFGPATAKRFGWDLENKDDEWEKQIGINKKDINNREAGIYESDLPVDPDEEAQGAGDDDSNDFGANEDELYESDTSGMAVGDVPALNPKEVKKRVSGLNVFGDDSEEEHLGDEDVLQEKFEKFVVKNCQDAKDFVKKGKLNIREFFNTKSYNYLNIVTEAFKKSLNEADESLQIDDVLIYPDEDKVVILYSLGGQDKEYETSKDDFFSTAEENDPKWEDFIETDTSGNEDYPDGFGQVHNTEAYWNSLSSQEHDTIVRNYLSSKGIV